MSQDNKGSNWREALDRHESPLDADRFFAGLEPHLPQPEKKRRRAAFWWQRLMLLAGVVLGGMWLLWPDNSVSEGTEAVEERTTIQKEFPATEKTDEVPEKHAILSPGETSQHEEVAFTKTSRALEKNSNVPQGTLSASSPVHEPSTPSHNKDASVIPPSAIAAKESSATSSIPSPVAAREEAHQASEAPGNLVEQTKGAIPPHNDVFVLPWLPGLLSYPERMEEAGFQKRALPSLALSRSRKAWQLHLDMMGGVGYPSRSLMATDLENAEFLTTRRSSETMLGAWNAGVDLRLYSPVGLFLQSGIRYHNITERFDWQTSEEDYRYELVDGLLMQSDGQLTPYQDSAWHRISSTRVVKHYNHIRTWDIPVALGYRHVWGPLSGDVAIGIQFNLKQSAEGRSLNLQGSPTYWNDEDALRYRNRIDMGAMLQGRLVWHPTPVYGIFVQPVLHLQPGSRTDASVTGYTLAYHTFYLQTGVSVRLF